MSVVDNEFVTIQPEDTVDPAAVDQSHVAQFTVSPTNFFRWKYSLDRFLAVLLLVPLAPIIGLLLIVVRLTSRGPAVFRQKRVGLNGRVYVMYKIRSMTYNAEVGTGPIWTTPNDVRVTLIGRVLRKLHLDELPQLFNVLAGDMSLVGPRPERPEFVRVLEDLIPGYEQRHLIRPGITGLAQINLPPDTDIASVRRKQQLDIEYIQKATLFLDFRMLLCTMLRMIGLSGQLAMKLMCLKRMTLETDSTSDADPNGNCLTPERIAVEGENGQTAHEHRRQPK